MRPVLAVAALVLVLVLGVSTAGSASGAVTASHPCANANTSVWRVPPSVLRSALVCLIDRARARRGLPALYEQRELDSAAQGHSDAMVIHDYFSHEGLRGSSPGARISAAGFDWGAYGEAISTGYRTAWQAIWGWLTSTPHCQILLSPMYRYIGIGIDPHGVPGMTSSGTWTADLALPLDWPPPSGDWGPANGCPY